MGMHPHIQVVVCVRLVGDFHRHAVPDHHIGACLSAACDVVDPHPSVPSVQEGSHRPDLVGTCSQGERVGCKGLNETVGIRGNGVELPSSPGSGYTVAPTGARGLAVGKYSNLECQAVDVLTQLVDQ